MGVCSRTLGAKQPSPPGTSSCRSCSAVWVDNWQTGHVWRNCKSKQPHIDVLVYIKYQGAKIKEIRDLTGAQINVSQESLPDSNERTVEVKTLLSYECYKLSIVTTLHIILCSPDNWLWRELPSDCLPCGLHHARDFHQGGGQTLKHDNQPKTFKPSTYCFFLGDSLPTQAIGDGTFLATNHLGQRPGLHL